MKRSIDLQLRRTLNKPRVFSVPVYKTLWYVFTGDLLALEKLLKSARDKMHQAPSVPTYKTVDNIISMLGSKLSAPVNHL